MWTEHILMYLSNQESNRFRETYYNFLPKCNGMTEEDYKYAIEIMSKKINRLKEEKSRYYSSLAWLFSQLPKTLNNYESIIQNHFCAIEADYVINSEVYHSNEEETKSEETIIDYKFTDNDLRFLQHTYCELSKFIFLPYLYGYHYSGVFNWALFYQIRDYLQKVMNKEVPSHSDICDIVSAVHAIYKNNIWVDFSVSNSPFLHSKIDRYIVLFQAVTPKMIEAKEKAFNELADFKTMKEYVIKDRDMSEYLSSFVSRITSSYRIAEVINSGKMTLQFQTGEKIFSTIQQGLEIIPFFGKIGSALTQMLASATKDAIEASYRDNAKNTVNSFYHKQIEEISEQLGVKFLYRHEQFFKSMILEEEQKKVSTLFWTFQALSKGTFKSYLTIITEQIYKTVANTFSTTDTDIYEFDVQTTAQELGFKDADRMVIELIGPGSLIYLPGTLILSHAS